MGKFLIPAFLGLALSGSSAIADGLSMGTPNFGAQVVYPSASGDDTTQFNTLLAAGKPLLLQAGLTYTACNVTVPNNSTIFGYGSIGYGTNLATPIVQPTGGCASPIFNVDSFSGGNVGAGANGSSVTFEGFEIKCSGQPAGVDGIGPGSYITSVRNMTIKGCDTGIGDSTSSHYSHQLQVSNSEFQANNYGAAHFVDSNFVGNGFTGSIADNVFPGGGGNFFANNRIEFGGGFGINFFSSTNDTVVGGQIEENARAGVNLQGTNPGDCTGINIAGVQFRGNGSNNSGNDVSHVQIINCAGVSVNGTSMSQLLGGNTVPQYFARFSGTNTAVTLTGDFSGTSVGNFTGTIPSTGILTSPNCGVVVGASAAGCGGSGSITSLQGLLSGDISAAAWTTAGLQLIIAGSTLTDSSSSGTVPNVYANKINGPVFTTTGTATFSKATTLDIAPPTCSNAGGGTLTCTALLALRLEGDLDLGNHNISAIASVISNSGTGYQLSGGAASSTAPTLLPRQAATSTGFGGNANNAIDVIVSGVDVMRFGTGSHAYGVTFGTAAANKTGYLCYDSSSTPANELLLDTVTCLASLEELKNIQPGGISGSEALHEIEQMRPFWYTWNQKTHRTSDTHVQPGLGAHAIEAIDPRLAVYDAHGHLTGVRYEQMTAVLVAGMQEQQSEIRWLWIAVGALGLWVMGLSIFVLRKNMK